MSILRTFILLGLVALAGCSAGPSVSLDQIQPKRVFPLAKEKTFETVRFFTLKEGYIVVSAEDETGRFFAHRRVSGRGNSSRLVIMNVKITAVDSTHTEVLARFTYSEASTSQTKEEEGILVDGYLSLFSTLESASE